MRRLVADLLLLARADAGRAARREPVEMGVVLREAAGELAPHGRRPRAQRRRGRRADRRRRARRPAPPRLNLIGNAVSHTPPGTDVRAGVHREDGTVVLTVEDDGPGVPPELGDRIFERFVRGAGDRRPRQRPGDLGGRQASAHVADRPLARRTRRLTRAR